MDGEKGGVGDIGDMGAKGRNVGTCCLWCSSPDLLVQCYRELMV